MGARELSIAGAWEFVPRQFPDPRGNFLVWYDAEEFTKALGHPLRVGQTNHSVSRKGVVRGVHWAAVPPGQAKYVYCPSGRILDVVVDLRVGSPTFGAHETVLLDQQDFRSLYVAEGLGHAFLALEEDSVLSYLCSERYAPAREFTVDAFDAELAIPWPAGSEPVRSDRDREAPSLAEARAANLLPSYPECEDLYETLRRWG